ncbi:hypothetical protein C7377_1704 [Balneicella halophila]|uniref:Lipopolysaccharide kinase (Kdo/WaaP) family protein n=1 Tax=Balneicella halophila TaxID=1537566 RepID=A0A7L4UNC2_BALHA|nr:hypothetical protein [Balneicella halophila]PVX50056.1 hypothetical protein C7377_1704 [Balneicella halophila]
MVGGENREIVINSKFRHLEEFVYSLPDKWDTIGETIYKSRNEIKLFRLDGIIVNVKSYQIPHLINKFAYAYLRYSKAKRTYYYAHKLQNMSVETPEPIAYINCFRNGLLDRSYFVSIQLDDYPITIREVIGKEIDNKELLLRQFTRFTYFSMLRHGVNHLDYSRGNILIKKDSNMYQFSIVDINRMRFEEMDIRKGLKMFSRLWAERSELKIIADEYAKITDKDAKTVTELLISSDKKHKRKIKRKNKYKKRFKKITRK